ncbi:hypothetical protein [Streptomyces sp. NPDC059131]|uniref:hypothetical protein n=1 Tax=Streptomyces sp. NPDC059131 TaxID=3346736 RepID=UPI00368B00A8
MTVHGEREIVPAATAAEAAEALKEFTDAYNAADKAYDPAKAAQRVTGALGAINQAGIKSRSVNYPDGNPQHVPLELTDARFTIPKKAGWPRFFLADADSNRDQDKGPADNRWVLVFLRNAPQDVWQAAYLTILSPDRIPALKMDQDGFAEAIAPDSPALARVPRDLSQEYASYTQTGKPEHFEAGPHTSQWRTTRVKEANRPGRARQYIDQPLNSGDYGPLGLATQGGGALVFFTVRNFERETMARGVRIEVHPDVKALLSGEVKTSLTKERISSQAAWVPAASSGLNGGKVKVLGRLTGLTSAKGS